MRDFEAYQAALNSANSEDGGEGSYMNSLMGSMCLVLEEFYNNLRVSTWLVIIDWNGSFATMANFPISWKPNAR